MKLNVVAFAAATALLSGGAVLLVAIANLASPTYGVAFLKLAASVYPGYAPGDGIGSVVTGTLYAAVDGAIAGLLFAWIYNLVAGRR